MLADEMAGQAYAEVGLGSSIGMDTSHALHTSYIRGGDLLPFRDLSLFLSQLVSRSLIIKLPKRVNSRKGTNP